MVDKRIWPINKLKFLFGEVLSALKMSLRRTTVLTLSVSSHVSPVLHAIKLKLMVSQPNTVMPSTELFLRFISRKKITQGHILIREPR